MDISKRKEVLPLYKKYNHNEYPTYINLNAIDVKKICDIPFDYEGLMGVPDSFLDKFNPEQFEIIGLGCGDMAKEIGVTKIIVVERILLILMLMEIISVHIQG